MSDTTRPLKHDLICADDLGMLRPAGSDAMASLRAAATTGDAALDLALLRVGILAPVDLDPIRSVLTRPACSLRATSNHDGHRIIEVTDAEALVALIHHDGRVFSLAVAA